MDDGGEVTTGVPGNAVQRPPARNSSAAEDGDSSTWQVVATANDAALSIDGAQTSSSEAFVIDSSSMANAGPAPVGSEAAAASSTEGGPSSAITSSSGAADAVSSSSEGPTSGGARASSASGATPTLPAGWEERQDANGRTYYVNHVCKISRIIRQMSVIEQIFNLNRISTEFGVQDEQWCRISPHCLLFFDFSSIHPVAAPRYHRSQHGGPIRRRQL